MSATIISEKRQTTLPADVCEAADLHANDQVDWTFAGGEIRGRKLSPRRRAGQVVQDSRTGLWFWRGDISAAEAEDAALSANLERG